MNLTPQQLDEVIEKYCDRVVDEMDTKSMEQMLYDLLVDSFQSANQHDMEDLICSIYDAGASCDTSSCVTLLTRSFQ